MLAVVVGICLVLSDVVFGQTCSLGNGIDFSNLPSAHCKNIIQVLDGNPGNPYNFDFNWCKTAASSSCEASYVVQGDGTNCDRAFPGWQSGMVVTNNAVQYTVNDGAGTTATVSIACDQGGNGGFTCPSEFQVSSVGNNHYSYQILLKSKCACPGGCYASPTTPPSPNNDLFYLLAMTAQMYNKPISWNASVPAALWPGVHYVNNALHTIDWSNFGIGGIVDLSNIPPTAVHVKLGFNNLTGTPSFVTIPSGLKSLFLNDNSFVGTINFLSTPLQSENLDTILLGNNKFDTVTNGKFMTPNSWCTKYQVDMCGPRSLGKFDCLSGQYNCTVVN